jgi:hypothetical protein
MILPARFIIIRDNERRRGQIISVGQVMRE